LHSKLIRQEHSRNVLVLKDIANKDRSVHFERVAIILNCFKICAKHFLLCPTRIAVLRSIATKHLSPNPYFFTSLPHYFVLTLLPCLPLQHVVHSTYLIHTRILP
jgi:hypothetical protein